MVAATVSFENGKGTYSAVLSLEQVMECVIVNGDDLLYHFSPQVPLVMMCIV